MIFRAIAFFLLAALVQPCCAAREMLAGTHIRERIACPAQYFTHPGPDRTVLWTHVVHHPRASYISLHFDDFDLGRADYVRVSDPAGASEQTFSAKGPRGDGVFWTPRITGDTAVIEFIAVGATRARALSIDRYAAGLPDQELTEDIMRRNDLDNAACYRGTIEYERARAVARLLVHRSDGDYWGTGFLVSPANHLLTVGHLITSSADAGNTQIDFMGEAPECGSPNCSGCYWGQAFIGADLVRRGVGLDYALLQINGRGNLAGEFGYLELDNRPAVLQEVIYIPQHSGGRAKEFAIRSDSPFDVGGVCHVQLLNWTNCYGRGDDIGYYADTEPGSSGSPVIARSNHKVIALNNCGGWRMNGGLPVTVFYDEVLCYLGVSLLETNVAQFPSKGGTVQVRVDGCSWGAQNLCYQWISVTPTSGRSTNVSIKVAPNYLCTPRECTLFFSGQPFHVVQDEGAGVSGIEPVADVVGRSGGTGTVQVTNVAACWTPICSADWLTVAPFNRVGPVVTVSYSATENPSTNVRSATITFGDLTFTLSQAGQPTVVTPGSYAGAFFDPAGPSHSRSGFFKMTATKTGRYSGSVQIGTKRYSLSGPFEVPGGISRTIVRKGDSPLTVELLAERSDLLSGKIGATDWSVPTDAYLSVYDGKKTVAPLQGRRTLLIQTPGDPARLPEGHGYGALTIDRAGKTRFSGSLADGTRMSQAGFIGSHGEWPLYIPLDGGKGSLAGKLQLSSAPDFQGKLSWSKSPNLRAKCYPAGFETTAEIKGCTFAGSVNRAPLLTLSRARLLVEGASVPAEWGPFFGLTQNNVLYWYLPGHPHTIRFSNSSGTFSGKTFVASLGKWIPFNGVVLQHCNYGSGYFVYEGRSGHVQMQEYWMP